MDDYRSKFAGFSPLTYLDCACQGPLPLASVERIHRAADLKARPDRLTSSDYFRLPERVRARIAGLTGAAPEEIALTTSATQGIGIVAAGLTLGPGDEVVVASSNFPSNLFTWLQLRRKGVNVKVIHPGREDVTPDLVLPALSARTRVLALDWVSYSTGLAIDLVPFGSLVHDCGGIFVVDGTQGVGANHLDLHSLPVDVMACAAYKWLLGPYGTGFAYVARSLLDKLDLSVVNWYSVEGAEDFDALPDVEFKLVHGARVFDAGETGNFINLHGLEASLELVEEFTVPKVHSHCRRLLKHLAEGLRERNYGLSAAALPGHESTILSFSAADAAATAVVHQKLLQNQVVVSLRGGMIRVSPYMFNDVSDIDRLLEIAGRA